MNVDLLPIINVENQKISFGGRIDFNVNDAVINADVDGYVLNFAGSLEVHGSVKATVVSPCARCLEPVTTDLDLTIDEVVGEDDVAMVGTVIDIEPIVYSEVTINLPIRFICSEECKGLCPKCGANLNITQCQCKEDEIIDERFLKPRFERRKR